MYTHNLDPIFINLGLIEIRWYSLAYIFGILIGWWHSKKLISFYNKENNFNFKDDDFNDLVTYLILAIIIGGRLGYVIFYDLSYYLDNLLEIFKIWKGGMSFHGALLGIILGVHIFATKKKLNSFFLLDIISCAAPIGILFGRIANFINAEPYGKPTDLPWSVVFPSVDKIPRHPSQLYEAILEGLVLFLILNFMFYRNKYSNGFLSGAFLLFYGFFRIFAEQFRTPDVSLGLFFGLFSMGTILSSIMIFFGILILLLNKNEKS